MSISQDSHQGEKLTRQISGVTSATAISRVLGYVRDMLVAQMFGASLVADAFYAAYRIPNLFRRLLGEGAVSISFVPVFTEYLETKNKDETQELLNIVFTTLLTVLVIITLSGIIFTRPLTKLIAWGFSSNPDKMSLTVTLTRIMFPYLVFVCMAALMLGVLNSVKSFFLSAISPAMLSVSEIIFVLAFSSLLTSPSEQVKWLAVSVVIGGFGQYILQQLGVFRKGFRIKFKYFFSHIGFRKISILMVPAVLAFSVDQINAFVDMLCATFLRHGSVTVLYYSNRLMQLPLALFGLAITTVALPAMSADAAKNEMGSMKDTLNFSLRMVCFTLIPATFGFIILGLPIIRVLFQRGRFDALASSMTYSALAFYSCGLIAYSSVKLLASAFYSLKEAKIPVRIASVCMLLNIVLNIVLMRFFKVGGLALATAISSWVNAVCLFYLIRKRIGLIGGRRIFHTFIKVLIASIVMGAAVYFLSRINCGYEVLKVGLTIIIAVVIYFMLAKIMKIDEHRLILNLFKQKVSK
jgi:putative peptidoglycan lipid II flippase